MVKPFPKRKSDAPTGSQFMLSVAKIHGKTYEDKVIAEILAGNVPDFMRPENWQSITVREKIGDMEVEMTLRVCPDYIALGSNSDYVRVPLSPNGLRRLTAAMGAELPTKKVVDIIDREAKSHNGLFDLVDAAMISRKTGMPLDKGTTYMLRPEFAWSSSQISDNEIRARKLAGFSLVSGQKKDVILHPVPLDAKNNLIQYRPNHPQGLDFRSHPKDHTDYSLGARLVDPIVDVKITGPPSRERRMNYRDIIMDKDLFRLLSDIKFDIAKIYASLDLPPKRERITV